MNDSFMFVTLAYNWPSSPCKRVRNKCILCAALIFTKISLSDRVQNALTNGCVRIRGQLPKVTSSKAENVSSVLTQVTL